MKTGLNHEEEGFDHVSNGDCTQTRVGFNGDCRFIAESFLETN